MGSHKVGQDWSDLAAEAEGYGNPLLYSFLPGEHHWQRSLANHSQQGHRELDTTEAALFCINARLLFPVAALLQGGWQWRWHSCQGRGDPDAAKCAGTWTASATGVMALSESFFWASGSWWSEGSLASFPLQLCLFKHLEGSLAWGPSLLFHASGT